MSESFYEVYPHGGVFVVLSQAEKFLNAHRSRQIGRGFSDSEEAQQRADELNKEFNRPDPPIKEEL